MGERPEKRNAKRATPVTPAADPLPWSAGPARLRRFSVGDLRAFQAYRHDPELGRFQGWSPQPDAEALEFIQRMQNAPILQRGEWSQIAIADPVSDELVGDVGLFLGPDGDTAEVGFTLSRAAQGRGVATAAVRAAIALVFVHSSAGWVRGITDARNLASIKVLERVGMRRVESRAAVFKGENCTELVFATKRERPRA